MDKPKRTSPIASVAVGAGVVAVFIAILYFTSTTAYNRMTECEYGVSIGSTQFDIMCHEKKPTLPDRPPLFLSEL